MPRFSTSSFVWRGIKQWSFTQNRLSSFVSRKTPKRRAGVSPHRVRRHDATAFCRCARALRLVQRCRRARLLRAFKRSKKKKKATRTHALLGEGDRSSSSEEDEKGQKSYLFLVFFTQNEILKIVSKKRGFKKKKERKKEKTFKKERMIFDANIKVFFTPRSFDSPHSLRKRSRSMNCKA